MTLWSVVRAEEEREEEGQRQQGIEKNDDARIPSRGGRQVYASRSSEARLGTYMSLYDMDPNCPIALRSIVTNMPRKEDGGVVIGSAS